MAIVLRNCDECGVEYEARRATSRYCGSTCRTRVARRPREDQVNEPAPAAQLPVAGDPDEPGGTLMTATLERLTAVERHQTALGQMALVLARRIESGRVDTGSSIASLSKEYRATMAAATDGTSGRRTPLDELRERRAAKLAG